MALSEQVEGLSAGQAPAKTPLPFDALPRGQELRAGDGGRMMLVVLCDYVPDEPRTHSGTMFRPSRQYQ